MDTSHEDSPSAANRRPSCYHDENTQKGYMGVAAPRNAASNRNYQGSAYGLEAATERLVSTTRVPRAESSHAPGKPHLEGMTLYCQANEFISPETRLPSALQHNLGPASLQRPLYEGVSGRPGKQYANFGPGNLAIITGSVVYQVQEQILMHLASVHPNSTTQAHPPVAYMAPSTGLGVFHPASGPEVHTPHGPGVTVSFGPRPSLGGGAAVGIGGKKTPKPGDST